MLNKLKRMWWFFGILIFISLLVVVAVIIRKIPQLRVIDVDSIQKERSKKIKEQLILSKLQRTGGARLQKGAKVFSSVGKEVSRYGRRAVQKLYRLEQYYQKLSKSASEGIHQYSEETIKKRLEEANKLIREDEFIPAEKIYIDIISHNPKSIEAYEALGNMYLANDQVDQAKETLSFTLTLSPDDASVNVSLADVAMKQDKPNDALNYLRNAVEKRSKNPKYLDYYIEIALQVGSLKDARSGISTLKEVNPENKKIVDFEKQFQEKKAQYISRTSSQDKSTSQKE